MRRKFILVLVLLLTLSYSLSYGLFLDMENHWGSEYVYWSTYEVRLFEGYPDGTFRPEQYITRAEYISILKRVVSMKNVDLSKRDTVQVSTHNYIDLKEEHWAYKDIIDLGNMIQSLNFTEIRLQDVFVGERLYPNRRITRYEAALLTRAVTTPPIEFHREVYMDISNDLPYFKEINELINNGMLVGYDNKFHLHDQITRAQSATIMKRVYDDLDYLRTNYLGLLPITTISSKGYPLFLVSGGSNISSNDKSFINAVTSLEYIKFIGYIPFEEQHLYDNDPIKTLWDLKERGYRNILGLNYYILNYDKSINNDMKINMVEQSLSHYIDLDDEDIEGIYSLLVYTNTIEYINKEILTQAAEKYFESITDIKEKTQMGVLISDIYYRHNNLVKAQKTHEELLQIEGINTQLKSDIILNLTYLKYLSDGKANAINYLDKAYLSLSEEHGFDLYVEDIGFKFTSFKKQLLMKP